MENQIEGGLNEFAGRVQDTLGAASADAGLQARGKLRQAAGRLQQSYGGAVDSLREQTVASPISAIAVSIGIGFVLGALWTRRG